MLNDPDARLRLLTTARKSFLAVGYQASDLERIAEEASLTPDAARDLFPDKQALVAASFYEELTAVVETGFSTLPTTGIVAQLCHLAEGLYQWHKEHPDIGRALIQANFLSPESSGTDLGQQLDFFVDAISKLLEEAKSNGELAPSVDVWLGSQGFFFDYLGVLIGALTGRVEFGPEQVEVLGGLTRMRLGIN